MQKYSFYTSFLSGLSAVGVSSSIYILHKVLSVSDSRMIILGQLSALFGGLMYGLASSDAYIYAGEIKRQILGKIE